MIDKIKIEEETDNLAIEGFKLYLSVLKFDEQNMDLIEEQEAKTGKLPKFQDEYEEWYTKCYNLIEKIAPYRLKDFVSLYKVEKRERPTPYNYGISDAVLGTILKTGSLVIAKPLDVSEKVKMQVDIIKSLKSLINDYFYNLEMELEYNIFDSELDSANELLKKKFLRPSGVIAGVVLEKHLKNICDNHNIQITKKDPGISDLNQNLKDGKIIDIPTWRKIQLMGDIRNICAHNKGVEPTKQQVIDLLDGTKTIISTIF